MTPLRVFIGLDRNELRAWHVCRASMLRHASVPLLIEPLDQAALRRACLYWRDYTMQDGQCIDNVDGKPFSTEFSFSRFVVPALCQWYGVALFCDSDFLWREDVAQLFQQFDPRYAVQVVKHAHVPRERVKMRGQAQTTYPRKNWSSLILWNCEHAKNLIVSPRYVNTTTGQQLHGFAWLDDEDIGALLPAWNWLEGVDSADVEPLAIHYTRGTPDMPGYEDAAYAEEWREYAEHVITVPW